MADKTGGPAWQIHPGTLYKYNAGVYCGVLVNERVMRELVRLQSSHLEQVKRLLTDAHEGEVMPYMWTLHHPEGKQTAVDFIDTAASLSERIKNAIRTDQPQATFPVFVAGSMDEAKAMADARHADLEIAA